MKDMVGGRWRCTRGRKAASDSWQEKRGEEEEKEGGRWQNKEEVRKADGRRKGGTRQMAGREGK